ncbi:hypothetical protein [Streptomyces sp. NPDC101150]|uniref:hypothetical protein n=1 Tax=Streptomyces sp. NPDC101150 TaxID=3366114 RepID=UPI0038048990
MTTLPRHRTHQSREADGGSGGGPCISASGLNLASRLEIGHAGLGRLGTAGGGAR